MENIYKKYVIHIDIKKLKAYKLKFSTVFTLYYHKLLYIILYIKKKIEFIFINIFI